MSDTDDPLYREIILEHWQNPQNYGVIKDADIDAQGDNPICGDHIRITAKLTNGMIADIAFTAEGCAISKASASLFTEYAKGKMLPKIQTLPQEEALTLLNVTITPARFKCALLPYNTLRSKT
jgi:nitrogen fixation protein NifU and related proteins